MTIKTNNLDDVLELIEAAKNDIHRYISLSDMREAEELGKLHYKTLYRDSNYSSTLEAYANFLNESERGMLEIGNTPASELAGLAQRYNHPARAPAELLTDIVKELFLDLSILETAYKRLGKKQKGIVNDETIDHLNYAREQFNKYLGKIYAGITGIGRYLPETNVTNHELEALIDTSDEWIQRRTWIPERGISHSWEDNVYMGVKAAVSALVDAGLIKEYTDKRAGTIKYEQLVNKGGPIVDKVLVITNHDKNGSKYPGLPGALQSQLLKLGINVAGIEFTPHGIGCEGFGQIVGDAKSIIENGDYSRVLTVSSENITDYTDWLHRNIAVVLGSGASAFVMESTAEPGIHAYHSISEGECLGGDVKPVLYSGDVSKNDWVNDIIGTRDRVLHGLLPKALLKAYDVDPVGDDRTYELVVDEFLEAVKKTVDIEAIYGKLVLSYKKLESSNKKSVSSDNDDQIIPGRIPGITMQIFGTKPERSADPYINSLNKERELKLEQPPLRQYDTALEEFVETLFTKSVNEESNSQIREQLLKGAVPGIILESYGIEPVSSGRPYEKVLDEFIEAAQNRNISCNMDGKKVFNWVVGANHDKVVGANRDNKGGAIYRVVTEMFEKYEHKIPFKLEDVDWVVPHQANGRMMPQIAKQLGIPLERFYINMSHANTSCSSIGIALKEMEEKGIIKDGQKILCPAFGAGLGTSVFAFTYRKNHDYINRFDDAYLRAA